MRVLAALCVAHAAQVCCSSWIELDVLERPRWRYSHGAALWNESMLVVTHGYNLRKPDGERAPDWRRDTWALTLDAVTGKFAWRELHPSGGPPIARYGHAFVRLADRLFLFGGDDGGAQAGSGSYVWGSYNSDVWVLECETSPSELEAPSGTSCASSANAFAWRQLPANGDIRPTPRSMHSCMAVRVPAPDHSVQAMLCFGGLVLADGGGADMLAGTSVLRDESDVWLMMPTAVEPTQGSTSVDAVSWIALQPGNAQPSALRRHGSALTYTTRILPPNSERPSDVCVEHSVWVFGGASSHCDTDALLRSGVAPSAFTSYGRGAMRGSGEGVTSCQLGDMWRLVWMTCSSAEAASTMLPAWRVPEGGHVTAADIGIHAHWQHVGAEWSVRPEHAFFAQWLRSRGAQRAEAPSPRSMSAIAATAFGAVLHGGALCVPGCDVFTDVWRLLVAPVPAAHACARAADGTGYETCLASVDGPSIGVAWVNEAHASAAQPSDEALSEYERLWTDGFRSATSKPPSVSAWPLTRHRHTLSSDDDRLTSAQLRAYDPAVTRDAHAAAMAAALHRARIPVIMFGGETYMPSTYYDDAWVWIASPRTSAIRDVQHMLSVASSASVAPYLLLCTCLVLTCWAGRTRYPQYFCCLDAYARLLCGRRAGRRDREV